MEAQLSVNDLTNLVNKAKDIIKSAKQVAFPQAWNVLQLAVAEVIQNIEDNNPNLRGADKKTLAMAMLSNFYDQVFTIINFPFVPKVLQPIIQKYVKQLLMILVSASIDALVTTFRQTGVFVNPSSTVNNEVDKIPEVSDK
jgi:hypothetical protein